MPLRVVFNNPRTVVLRREEGRPVWNATLAQIAIDYGPILVTTNKPLAAWGAVLHDGDVAEAILDRLLERGSHFAMRGRSYRTRHLTD